MSYTTIAIVRAESPFKDDDKIGDTVIQRAIDEMASFIDGKIGGVYQLPLDSTPVSLQGINTTLAVYELIKDQNLNIEIASGVNIQQMVEDAVGFLDEVMMRKQKLFDGDSVEYALVPQVKVKGYPDETDTESGDATRLFTMAQEF